MATKQYKSNKRYKCPYCEEKYYRNDLISHVEKKHKSLFPEGYDAIRVVYDSINKTDHGKCMICGKPVYEWDSKHYKYKNLCDNPRCREEVRKIALQRHIKVYNKPTLLDDPNHQEKMLARRKISGSYTFTDGGTVNYTGKYERNALEFIDKVMGYKSSEIECPGPVLTYEYNGETHNYISDIFIIPANLLIEVKDGGKNPNNRNMPEYRAKQIAKEEMITKLGTMNYLRLTDNQFGQLLAILADIKLENLDNSDNPAKKFHINESCSSLDDARNLVRDVSKLAKKHNANFFFVTDGASGYSNGNGGSNPAVKEMRRHMDDWERANGFDPDEDWSKNESAQTNDMIMKLYHISSKSDISKIEPSIPNNFMTKNGYEENKTKRVCFAPSINQCLMGLSRNCSGEEFYVYTPAKKYKLYKPSIKEVPDSRITGEVWIKESVEVNCLGKIKVTKDKGLDGHKYTYGKNNTTELYDWDYEFINESSSVLAERYLINEEDIYYNKDKFDSGKINLCFITGHSGSGKSTMGRNMGSNNIEHYELDDLQCVKDHFTMDDLKEYGDLIYSYFKGPGKKFYITYDELVEKDMHEGEYEDILFPEFVKYAMKYASLHKDKKIVLEGIWFYCVSIKGKPWFEPNEFKDYAFYIKGTSMMVSKYRAAKRDAMEKYDKIIDRFKEFNKNYFKNFKFYLFSEKQLNKFRSYFKNLMKNNINEAACPSCGGGIPASCATIPRGVNIATDSIQLNGEIGPFVFSYPEDDECVYFDGNGNYEVKNKNECGEFNYLVEVKLDDTSKVNDIYRYITNTNTINIKNICNIATGRMPMSLMEMVLGYREIVFHDMMKINAEKYMKNGMASLRYILSEPVLRKQVGPHVSIAYCEEGYFAFTDKYPFATTFRKNRESIRKNEIEALSRLYSNYDKMSD